MKKTSRIFLGPILCVALISSLCITAVAIDDCAHPDVNDGVCLTCQAEVTINTLEHEHLHDGEPNCQGHWCDICSDYYGEPDPEGHIFEDYEHSLVATCELDAQESAKCLYCEEVDVRVVQDTAAHTWEDATCTSPMTCLECGEVKGEALGHIWSESEAGTEKESSLCLTCGEAHSEPEEGFLLPDTSEESNWFVSLMVMIVQFVMMFILKGLFIPI